MYALTEPLQPSVLPLPELIARINAIWDRKGIKPKQHLSSPCPGAESVMEKRKHADRCYELPPDLPDDMDLMIEVRFPLVFSLRLCGVLLSRDRRRTRSRRCCTYTGCTTCTR